MSIAECETESQEVAKVVLVREVSFRLSYASQ